MIKWISSSSVNLDAEEVCDQLLLLVVNTREQTIFERI